MTVTDSGRRTAVVDVPRDCTFDAADFAIIARYWYPVALSGELSTAPLAATLLDEPLVVYRAGDAVVVGTEKGSFEAQEVIVAVPPAIAARIAYRPAMPASRPRGGTGGRSSAS